MSKRRLDNRARREEVAGSPNGPWLTFGAILLVLLVITGAITGAATLAGIETGHPLPYIVGLMSGRSAWNAASTAWLAVFGGIGLLLLGGLVVLAVKFRSKLPKRKPIDVRSASMAAPSDFPSMIGEGALKDRDRLKVDSDVGTGTPIAALVRPQWWVKYPEMTASYEWVGACIMGPRAGKTSCMVVRQICETAGSCLCTSNKRDIVDLTRGRRQKCGHCWVFDPQDLIGEPPNFWWNPLSFVTDYAKATELAGLFASSSADVDAKKDAYFDTAGEEYLASLLFAAALGQHSILEVWNWLSNADNPDPVDILKLHSKSIPAKAIGAIANLSDGQRDGVVGTARKMMGWIANEAVYPWITDPGGTRPEFKPTEFALTQQTLYLISREGSGSARAITAALAVATMRAAEHLAGRSPGGRLPRPMSVILDEAANVVRWRDLPSLYSHFGSRGILLVTYFQSWAQGCAAFGTEGMKTLWSAANFRIVGAGVAESGFLEDWAKMIGEQDVISRDDSMGPSQGNSIFSSRRSVSRRLRRERIFEVSELAGLPTGRAIMVSSGAPAALLKLTHWSETTYAADVAASEKHYIEVAQGRTV